MQDAPAVPVVQGLPGGEPGSLAAGAQVRGVAAGGLLGEQDSDEFGVVPALRSRGRDQLEEVAADVGKLEPPRQFDGLGQRISARSLNRAGDRGSGSGAPAR